MQQLQQQQQQAYIHGNPAYQTQLAQLLALRQMQQQAPSQQLHQQYGQLQGIQVSVCTILLNNIETEVKFSSF